MQCHRICPASVTAQSKRNIFTVDTYDVEARRDNPDLCHLWAHGLVQAAVVLPVL